MLNEALFRATIKALRTEGQLRAGFHMGNWLNTCGTAGCIAGSAVILAQRNRSLAPNASLQAIYGRPEEIGFRYNAATLLGLTDAMSFQLFAPGNWTTSLYDGDFLNTIIPTPNNPLPPTDYVEDMARWAENVDLSLGGLWPKGYGRSERRVPISPDYAALTLEHILERHPHYVDWMAPWQELEKA